MPATGSRNRSLEDKRAIWVTRWLCAIMLDAIAPVGPKIIAPKTVLIEANDA